MKSVHIHRPCRLINANHRHGLLSSFFFGTTRSTEPIDEEEETGAAEDTSEDVDYEMPLLEEFYQEEVTEIVTDLLSDEQLQSAKPIIVLRLPIAPERLVRAFDLKSLVR